MGLNHSQLEEEETEKYPGEEPEPSRKKELVPLKLVMSEELAPPKEVRRLEKERRAASKERAPVIKEDDNKEIEEGNLNHNIIEWPVSNEITDPTVREEADLALPADSVPSSAPIIISEKKNLHYLKKLSRKEWNELDKHMERMLDSYIISSLWEITNNESLEDEERIDFAFRYLADEVYREITEVYKPLGDSKGSKMKYRVRKPKIVNDLEMKLQALKQSLRKHKRQNLESRIVKKEMNKIFRELNVQKKKKKKVEEEKQKQAAINKFFQNPWKYTINIVNQEKIAPKPTFTAASAKDYYSKQFGKGEEINFGKIPHWIEDQMIPEKSMEEEIEVSVSQYRRILKKKKSWSRCGRDGIPYGVYKNLSSLDETIVWLFNCIGKIGNHYPKCWQAAEACFIYKKG
jgi:hypothetical protein